MTSSGSRVAWPGSLVLMPIEVGVVFNDLTSDVSGRARRYLLIEAEISEGGGDEPWRSDHWSIQTTIPFIHPPSLDIPVWESAVPSSHLPAGRI